MPRCVTFMGWFLLAFGGSTAPKVPRTPAVRVPRVSRQRHSTLQPKPSSANCTWVYVDQPLSHYDPGAAGSTFKQRLCIYDKYWSGGEKQGPIFLYVGNESPVDEYINATGLMWESAPEFGALLVFAEHRYFGESMPQIQGRSRCLAWLSSNEALADYASVVEHFRTNRTWRWSAPESAVIAFGGSYGGMLAAWFRMRYPSQVDGSIAGSAPIWGFPGDEPAVDGASAALTNAATEVGGSAANCVPNMRATWVLVHDLAKSSWGRTLISKSMGLCTPMKRANQTSDLLGYLQGPLFNIAEGDYPFPSDYITFATFNGTTVPLPAWPMRKVCEPLAADFGIQTHGEVSNVKFSLEAGGMKISVDWDETANNSYTLADVPDGVPKLLAAAAKGLQVWYNLTGSEPCVNWTGTDDSADAPEAFLTPGQPISMDSLLLLKLQAHAQDTQVLQTAQTKAPHSKDVKRGDNETCGDHQLDVGLAWGALVCNEGLNLVNTAVMGIGRDLFWPPTVQKNATLKDVVDGSLSYCKNYAHLGLHGLPEHLDEWGKWMDTSYGGRRIRSHTNIFFSNGNLDPWSSAGVLPPSLTPALPSSLVNQGGHHLDLFFSTEMDPASVRQVRARERAYMAEWVNSASRAKPIQTEFQDQYIIQYV